MNGRVFDQKIGRFLSADPFVQALGFSQSFNRYSYTFNNPLSFVDPSGYAAQGPDDERNDYAPSRFLYSFFSSVQRGFYYNGVSGRCTACALSRQYANEHRLPREPVGTQWTGAAARGSAVDGNGGILSSFGRGFLGTYRSVVDGPVPWSEQLGRSSRQTLDDLITVAGIGLMAVPGGQAGGAALLETRAAGAVAGSIRNVNPLRSLTNCVNCVIATDATLAGRAASALASGPTQIALLESLFGGQFSRVGGRQAIEALLVNAGSGARGIVYGSRGAGEVGHVFNAVNQNGTIRFLDGQIGGAASFKGYVEFFFLRTF